MKYIVFVVLLINSSLFAQELVLDIHKKKSNRIVEINLEKKIRVYTIDNIMYIGKVTEVQDSGILLGNDFIAFVDIVQVDAIKVSQEAWGAIWITTGGFITIVNGYKLGKINVFNGIEAIPFFGLGIILLTHGVFTLYTRTRFKSTKWEFNFYKKTQLSIRTDSQVK